MVAVNPYCKACAKEFFLLNHLLTLFPEDLNITFRFRIVPGARGDVPNTAVLYLLNAYSSMQGVDEKKRVLQLWFKLMNLADWRKHYRVIKIKNEYVELCKKYQDWFEESNIKYTPTLFVNGFEFPKPFLVSDLKQLLPELISSQTVRTV